HCRDERSADEFYQDCRYRRSGPLHVARIARCELQRLGPRIRSCRFTEDPDEARNEFRDPESESCEDATRGGPGVSGQLLALAHAAARAESLPWHGRSRQWCGRRHAHAESLEQLAEIRLQFLSPAREQADAHAR